MARIITILLVAFLAAAPLLGQDGDRDAAALRVEEAKLSLARAKEEAAVRYKELETDFELLRSESWAALRAPYIAAVEKALQSGPAALASDFTRAGFLSETAASRLAAAATPLIAAGADPAEVLEKSVARVFPAASFAECWDSALLDLPEVAKIAAAAEELKVAEAALGMPPAPGPGVEPPPPAAGEGPPDMVLIPRGPFEFGPWTGSVIDLKPNRGSKEQLQAYYVDVHEVTNAQYRDFLVKLPKSDPLWGELPTGFARAADGTVTFPENTERHPVRGVTYEMANACAKSVGKRLPTEEEWEKAARGENGLLYPWGNEYKADAANLKETGLGAPTAVGAFADDRSPYGVMDMAGNVAEITCTLVDGRKPPKGKPKATDSIVLRGGSGNDGKDSAVTTYRWIQGALNGRSDWVGFRCVLSEKDWKRAH